MKFDIPRGVLTLILFVASLAVSRGSDMVIDGDFSTGTMGSPPNFYFAHWETDGASWPKWMMVNYDTNHNGVEDPCFHFRPKMSLECTLVQPVFLINGRTYEFSMDAAFYNT